MNKSDWEVQKWSNFMDTFNVPSSGQDWANRVTNNLQYYRANYAIIAAGISLFTLFFYPNFLTAVVLSAAVAFGLFQAKDIKVSGRRLNSQEKIALSALSTFVILYLTGSFFPFYWAFSFSFGTVVAHASLRKNNIKNLASNTIGDIKSDIKGIFRN